MKMLFKLTKKIQKMLKLLIKNNNFLCDQTAMD